MTQLVATISLDTLSVNGRRSSKASRILESSRNTAISVGSTDFAHPTSASAPAPDTIPPACDDWDHQNVHLHRGRAVLLIGYVFLIYLISSFTNALITIGIPSIVADIKLDPSLLYWPVLVYTLTCAALLLPAGSVADVTDHRMIMLVSTFCLGCCVLTCGLARTGQELIAFRALGGASLALFLPTSTSIVSTQIPKGRMRNVGFSLLGVGQVIGFSIGLVLSGVFASTVGWRFGWYLCGAILIALSVAGPWALPQQKRANSSFRLVSRSLYTDIDWIGVILTSGAIAILAYLLAQISVDVSNIKLAANIALLAVGILLIPVSIAWFHYREKCKKSALIPNSLWNKLPFSAICIMVMFAYAQMQTMELLASLFFQEIQDLSAIETSVRLIPSMVVAVLFEVVTGAVVHRVPAVWLVCTTSAMSSAAPVLMAVIKPEWPYWYAAFPAQILQPLCCDVLYTVALLVISEIFSDNNQALAGAVFNVVGQLGQAFGLAIISIITNSVSQHESAGEGHMTATTLMSGYRAGFWTVFAWLVALFIVSAVGLRRVGKVGLKRD